jgi:hypothetical protein
VTDPVGSAISRLRWFLGRLIAPVRSLGAGETPTTNVDRAGETDGPDDTDER